MKLALTKKDRKSTFLLVDFVFIGNGDILSSILSVVHSWYFVCLMLFITILQKDHDTQPTDHEIRIEIL